MGKVGPYGVRLHPVVSVVAPPWPGTAAAAAAAAERVVAAADSDGAADEDAVAPVLLVGKYVGRAVQAGGRAPPLRLKRAEGGAGMPATTPRAAVPCCGPTACAPSSRAPPSSRRSCCWTAYVCLGGVRTNTMVIVADREVCVRAT
jgi:hypothetical protein